MTYRIMLSPASARQLRKFDPQVRRRIQGVLELLAVEPCPPAAIRLVGGAGEWRVRTGDYRILYGINDQELLVMVLRESATAARFTGRGNPCRSSSRALTRREIGSVVTDALYLSGNLAFVAPADAAGRPLIPPTDSPSAATTSAEPRELPHCLAPVTAGK